MARIAAAIKLGYYPLPEEHGPSLRARLEFPPAAEPAAALDPCAGTGAALRAITSNSGAHLYGVELDAKRAESARKSGIDIIQGSAFDVRSRVERFSLLYLNPPYDFEIGPFANKRMESLFLAHTYTWLRPKGVLIMVIPGRAVSDVSDTLAARFEDIRIYRMEGELSRRYDQYAVFGVRHNNNGRAQSLLKRQITDAMWRPSLLPVLTPDADKVYAVPPGGEVQLTYRGIPLDAVEDALPSSTAWRHAAPLLLPKPDIAGGRPLTPLHGGHVGLLATAGMLNGVFGSDDDRHLARWRAVKHSYTTREHRDGQTIERTVERFSNELALVFASGKTQILTETKPAPVESQNETTAKPTNLDFSAEEAQTPGKPKARFEMGKLAMTAGVRDLMVETGSNFTRLLARHAAGDWGELSDEDKQENEIAVENGEIRILSSYVVPEIPGGKLWIITEADRSVTTILLPSEY